MSSDPGIICFQHCSSRSIICKEVPEKCPLCESTMSEYIIQPFRLPYPFVNASESPVAVAVRPSNGDFLNHYTVTDDLHIGITNSEGRTIEFDKYGVIDNDVSKWTDCLALRIVPEAWTNHWDCTLEAISTNAKWCADNYNEDNMNCFSFVIEFMQNLKYENLKYTTKEEFCETFVLPKIRDTLKYVSFYRKLKDNNYFVLD